MDDKIRSKLFDIERDRGVHVINARERGSRMLGVAHDESDYDVMFLFAQDASKYATLQGYIETIDKPHLGENEDIDLHGWNIDKFGRLLSDSNPNAIEYCRDDAREYITFYEGGVFDETAKNARENFNHMALYVHYISMAKRNYSKYIESGKDCTKGRQFYVARALACASHIRNEGALPPMNAYKLSDSDGLNEELDRVLYKLAEAKKRGHGGQENPDIVGPLYKAESQAPMEPTDERINSPDKGKIDELISTALVR